MPQDLINAKPAALRCASSSVLAAVAVHGPDESAVRDHAQAPSLRAWSGRSDARAAGFEVRDVHPTHYGRICPIETPEGPNIGLINSLATFARMNKYGFIESALPPVKDGKVTDEVVYLSAMEEANITSRRPMRRSTRTESFTEDLIVCRHPGDLLITRATGRLHGCLAEQLVSVAAALIPFLENDDANRALMGSNMQRQAVPLVKPTRRLSAPAWKSIVARNSGAAIAARRTGVVDQVDATRIVVRATEDSIRRSRASTLPPDEVPALEPVTCIKQKPLVQCRRPLSKGDIIADGPSTDLGDLALGSNLLVAFMPWNGYNFEDSILL